MKLLIILLFVAHSWGGIIHDSDHHHATSYQSLHMEHYAAEPTYLKKGGVQSTQKSFSAGKTDSEVEIHHGSKHEPGYAVANIHSEMYGHHGGHQFVAAGGHNSAYTENSSPEHDDSQNYELGHGEQYSDSHEGREYAESGGESAEYASGERSHHGGYATSGEEESYQ